MLVAIRILDLDGNPVGGGSITFEPSHGSALPAQARSEQDGSLSTRWTLGEQAGPQTLRIVANGATAVVAAAPGPGDPSGVTVVSGDGVSAPVGELLVPPPHFEITDRFGNPVPGVEAMVVISAGGGSVGDSLLSSDAAGAVRPAWVLGEAIGPQALGVGLTAGAFASVSVTGVAGPPSLLTRVSGDGATATVGTAAPALRVLGQDRFGNVTAGASVQWVLVQGNGALSSAATTADAAGEAEVTLTLGTAAGANVVEARVAGAAPVQFALTGTAGPPASLAKTDGDQQQGPSGTPLAQPLRVFVADGFGNGVSGTSVDFTVAAGGGSVNPTVTQTDSTGQASTTVTLGPALGSHTVSASAGALGSVLFTLQATVGPPAAISLLSGGGQSAEVGTDVSVQPSVLVTDLGGNPVPNVLVTFTITGGGGAVTGASTGTSAQGVASLGAWTLGNVAGQNTLSVSAGNAPAATVAATGTPAAAATLMKVSGDAQSGTVGATLPIDPRVQVVDAFGNGVPGITVTFAVAGGGGVATGATPLADGSGFAAVGSWTLGASPGLNTLTATVTGLAPVSFTATGNAGGGGGGAFNVEMQFLGSATASQQQILLNAAARWATAITGDVADVNANLAAGACGGLPHPAYAGTVDDVVIFVQVTPIDGPGGTLGSAGPCFIRSGSGLPVFGHVRLDSADVAALESSGRLFDVVLHEVGHVLGIGTLWQTLGLLTGAGTADPFFTGTSAIAQFGALGGTATNPVPVENTGGPGTRDGHWREAVFGSELMTGFLGGSNPMSTVTIASLGDMGYSVNLGAADGYALPAPLPPGVLAPPLLQLNELPVAPPRVLRPDEIRPSR